MYAGPAFSLNYKYSYIMVVVYVTFLFGAGLPILFPIAYVSLLGFYITEKLCMAYSNRIPPMFTTEANQATMKILMGAPMIYCAVGAWLFSNQQIFENSVVVNDTSDMFANSDHTFAQFFTQITPGTAYFLCFAVAFTFYFIRMINKVCKRYFGFSFLRRIRNSVNAQRLPTFFRALRVNQRKSFLIEERKCREKLGIKRLPLDSYESLVKDTLFMSLHKKMEYQDLSSRMEGVHTYNFLANPNWYDKYMYMPYTVNNRDDYIVSMYKDKELKKWSLDIVRYVCDLAYVPQGRAKAMEFNPEYLHFESKRRQNATEKDVENTPQ